MHISGFHFRTKVVSLSDYEFDDLSSERLFIVIVSTWTGGTPNNNTSAFFETLQDHVHDFRVSKNILNNVHFSVFGLGNR